MRQLKILLLQVFLLGLSASGRAGQAGTFGHNFNDGRTEAFLVRYSLS